MKSKFREALDKKQSHGGSDVSDDTEHGKVDHAHGRRDPGDAADVPPQERRLTPDARRPTFTDRPPDGRPRGARPHRTGPSGVVTRDAEAVWSGQAV